jgi:hypothetical protein
LRCPFGCRQHHRRQRSNERSTAYYQTPAGKRKKKRLNARRSGCPDSAHGAAPPDPHPPTTSTNEGLTEEGHGVVELALAGVVLDESSLAKSPMLPYVGMLVNLIEGIQLSPQQLVCLLWQAMRQHSIGGHRRIDYVLGFLHQHPP